MAKRGDYDWSQTSDEELGRMFLDEGLSGTEIALRLGHGLTHSAVMGRLARIGIKKGKRPPAKPPRPARPPRAARIARAFRAEADVRRVPMPAATATPTEETGPVSRGPVGLIAAMEAPWGGLCRAPLASATSPEFAYCDAAATENDYCALHARLYYQAPSGRHRRK